MAAWFGREEKTSEVVRRKGRGCSGSRTRGESGRVMETQNQGMDVDNWRILRSQAWFQDSYRVHSRPERKTSMHRRLRQQRLQERRAAPPRLPSLRICFQVGVKVWEDSLVAGFALFRLNWGEKSLK